MVKRKKSKVFDLDSVQLDLFENRKKEWEKHGFATREQWIKAREYDRAFRHMEQANFEYLKKNERLKERIRKYFKKVRDYLR